MQFDETGNRKRKSRYGDEDEIEMEQQERKRKAMMNKEVKAFAEKIADAAAAVRVTFASPLSLSYLFLEWGQPRAGHSFPRTCVRGCAIQDQCHAPTYD